MARRASERPYCSFPLLRVTECVYPSVCVCVKVHMASEMSAVYTTKE